VVLIPGDGKGATPSETGVSFVVVGTGTRAPSAGSPSETEVEESDGVASEVPSEAIQSSCQSEKGTTLP